MHPHLRSRLLPLAALTMAACSADQAPTAASADPALSRSTYSSLAAR